MVRLLRTVDTTRTLNRSWRGRSIASNESWDQHLAVNAKGVLFCFKYGAKQMITQGRGGRLLAAASTSGMQGSVTGVCQWGLLRQTFD